MVKTSRSQIPTKPGFSLGDGAGAGARTGFSRVLGPPRILTKHTLAVANANRDNRMASGAANNLALVQLGGGGVAHRRVMATRTLFTEKRMAQEMLIRESSPSASLKVSPFTHLAFTGPFTHRSHSTLHLESVSERERVAFKIKSTAPKGRLAVRPCRSVWDGGHVTDFVFIVAIEFVVFVFVCVEALWSPNRRWRSSSP